MTYGSLFTGIGGIDLGLDRAGFNCRWQVEIDPFCRAVLEKHWPGVTRYGDIRDVTDFAPVDLICGGFPCQPVSVAGRRKGTEDTRWLWPEFSRVIGLVKPRWVLVENVPGLRTANRGAAFAEVLQDLAGHGYDAEWASIPAACVGAPHLRYRVFLVAYHVGFAREDGLAAQGREGQGLAGCCADVADSRFSGLEERPGLRGHASAECSALERDGLPNSAGTGRSAEGCIFPRASESTGTLSLSARSDWWSIEPDVGRVAYGVPARVDRLRALGNAVVPQVAEWVGRQIVRVERLFNDNFGGSE